MTPLPPIPLAQVVGGVITVFAVVSAVAWWRAYKNGELEPLIKKGHEGVGTTA